MTTPAAIWNPLTPSIMLGPVLKGASAFLV